MLFNLLRPLFESLEETFWLEDYDNFFKARNLIDLDDVPSDVFMQAYEIIKNANDKDLQPFVPEILHKMQADPRYLSLPNAKILPKTN